MKRIRIVSTGPTISTRIYDVETGQELLTVEAVRIEIDGERPYPTVWLKMGDVELDIVAAQVDEEGKQVE